MKKNDGYLFNGQPVDLTGRAITREDIEYAAQKAIASGGRVSPPTVSATNYRKRQYMANCGYAPANTLSYETDTTIQYYWQCFTDEYPELASKFKE